MQNQEPRRQQRHKHGLDSNVTAFPSLQIEFCKKQTIWLLELPVADFWQVQPIFRPPNESIVFHLCNATSHWINCGETTLTGYTFTRRD